MYTRHRKEGAEAEAANDFPAITLVCQNQSVSYCVSQPEEGETQEEETTSTTISVVIIVFRGSASLISLFFASFFPTVDTFTDSGGGGGKKSVANIVALMKSLCSPARYE